MKKWIPWMVFGLFLIYVAESAVRSGGSTGGINVADFGRLPVLLNGRVQPLDSVARNSLLQIRSTGDVPLEEIPTWQKAWRHPKKLRSTEWLLEVLMRPEAADQRQIFLVHHPELLGWLGLKAGASGLGYVSFKELEPKLDDIEREAGRISRMKPEERTSFEQQLLKLQNAMIVYHRLKNSLQPNSILQRDAGTNVMRFDFAAQLAQYRQDMAAGLAAMADPQAAKPENSPALAAVTRFLEPFGFVSRAALPMTIPPLDPAHSRDAWQNLGASLIDSLRKREVHPAIAFFAGMSSAYSQEKPAEFNQAVAAYRQWLTEKAFSPELAKGRQEFFFNQFQPFKKATAVYIVAFILGCVALLNRSAPVRHSALSLAWLAFAVHTGGILYRMILEGRPPVTNLYSSAIFVGWGTAVLGLILEHVHRNGLGVAMASLVGFITQLIAHNLALGGDTMEMMRAVLDTNFWLATHVVTITIGYSATFLAGFLAIAYVLLGVFSKSLDEAMAASLDRMVYAIVCFATLFSFIGTVLGGIWADQSWGRFWGWDPKENGALLIVLWNAIYLHVRWGKMTNERVWMALAVFGNIVTAFSWFGVNMLNVGLHSYGFMDGGRKWLSIFVLSQLAVIGLAFLPERFWPASVRKTEGPSLPADSPAVGGARALPPDK